MIGREICVLTVLAIGSVFMVAGDNEIPKDDAGPNRGTTRVEQEAINRLRRRAASHGITFTPSGLIGGLDHKEMVVRALCLRSLAKVGDLNAISPMGRLLSDPNRGVRETAVIAIHEIVSRETHASAQKLYEESTNVVDRFRAAVLLCRLGDPSRYEDVLDVLGDSNSSLMGQALRSVPMFAKYQIFEGGKPVDWVEPTLRILMDQRAAPSLRQASASALATMGTPAALDSLERVLPGETDSTVKHIIESALMKRIPDAPVEK